MRIAVRYQARPMALADISQVMEIERESFPSMWPPTAFRRELQQNRLARYMVAVQPNPSAPRPEPPAAPPAYETSRVGRLLGELRHMLSGEEEPPLPPPEERPELVVGFIGVWLLPDEAHIVTVAVRDSHRREGIGEYLVIAAIELAQIQSQPLVTLECRVSNEPALKLYEKYGFQQLGLRPRYYSDNHEDAFILTTTSVLSRKFREEFERLKALHRRRWGDFESYL